MYTLGLPMLAFYLLSIAQGPEAYSRFLDFSRSWIGTVILFGLTWCFCQHFASGLRHLFMDTGKGLHLQASNKTARATYVFSFGMTLVIWIAVSLR